MFFDMRGALWALSTQYGQVLRSLVQFFTRELFWFLLFYCIPVFPYIYMLCCFFGVIMNEK